MTVEKIRAHIKEKLSTSSLYYAFYGTEGAEQKAKWPEGGLKYSEDYQPTKFETKPLYEVYWVGEFSEKAYEEWKKRAEYDYRRRKGSL